MLLLKVPFCVIVCGIVESKRPTRGKDDATHICILESPPSTARVLQNSMTYRGRHEPVVGCLTNYVVGFSHHRFKLYLDIGAQIHLYTKQCVFPDASRFDQ